MTLPTHGKAMLLKVADDMAQLQAVAGLRAKSVSMNAELIDVTNSDSVDLWRELLAGDSVRSLAMTGSGIAKDATTMTVIQDMFRSGALRECEITVPGITTITVDMKFSSLKYDGNYNDALMFDFTLESSGDPEFVAV